MSPEPEAALGWVPVEGRGSLPFDLLDGESLVAWATWALGDAGVEPVDFDTPWADVRASGRTLVLHDPLCPLTPSGFLSDLVAQVDGAQADESSVLVGVRPVTDTIKAVEADRVVGDIDRTTLRQVASPVVLPPVVLQALDAAPDLTDPVALVEQLRARFPVRFVDAPTGAAPVIGEHDPRLSTRVTTPTPAGEASPARIAVVVLAAGSGSRAGPGANKALREAAGVSLVAWSVQHALTVPGVHRCVVVCREDEREDVAAAVAPVLGRRDVWLVTGGETRHESEESALAALRQEIADGEIDLVAIHDAARPVASPSLWLAVVSAAADHGAAVPGLPVGRLIAAEPGVAPPINSVGMQTPQAFAARPLLDAYDAARRDGFLGTDTAGCLGAYTDVEVVVVPGEPTNLKVTWPEDLAVAAALLAD